MDEVKLVDSHCHLDHLDLKPYQGDLDGALQKAYQNKVGHFLCVCINIENLANVLAIAEQYPNVYATIGMHPNEDLNEPINADQLVHLSKHHPKIIGIGETGLDYFRTEKAQLEKQQERFRAHIHAAKKLKLPVIIHSRQAREDTIRIMEEEKIHEVGGVLHCFTEDWEMAKQAIDLGCFISFSGIVTFPNAKDLQEVAKKVPLEAMLVETDSPYLAPIPFRGKPNEPAYVRYVAEHIASLKNITWQEVAEQTTKNFQTLFNVKLV